MFVTIQQLRIMQLLRSRAEEDEVVDPVMIIRIMKDMTPSAAQKCIGRLVDYGLLSRVSDFVYKIDISSDLKIRATRVVDPNFCSSLFVSDPRKQISIGKLTCRKNQREHEF